MRSLLYSAFVVACLGVHPHAASAATQYIVFVEPGDAANPPSDTERDGPVYGPGGGNVQPETAFGFAGRWSNCCGNVAWSVSKFKLSNFLPAGTGASDVAAAYLSVPYTDVLWGGDPFTDMDLVLHHFATLDNNTITASDYHTATPPLTDYGIIIPRHTQNVDTMRRFFVNVTPAIKNDLAAGRMLSSFRIGADPAGELITNDLTYFATADNTNNNGIDFGPVGDQANRNVLKLILFVGPPEVCNNGLDDDADGQIDCADSECGPNFYHGEPCQETVCNNGIDGDGDGLADCADPDCTGSLYCPEVCNDGIDNNADGQIDCADGDCAGHPSCPEFACADALDNDSDGKIDCADPDCFGKTGCTSETVCGDGQDNDGDCLIDAADPTCNQGVRIVFVPPGNPTQPPSDTERDGSTYGNPPPGTNVNVDSQCGFAGRISGLSAWAVSKFKLSDFLPPGTTSAQIAQATLSVPNVNYHRQGDPFTAMDLVLEHFATTNDTVVTSADHDANTPFLTNYGIIIPRHPNPGSRTPLSKVLVDVTAAIKGDLDNGRALSSFRVGADPSGDLTSGNDLICMPMADDTDAAYGPLDDQKNRNVHKLLIKLVGQFESSCTDGVDNDGDGAVDCNDADCYNVPPDPVELYTTTGYLSLTPAAIGHRRSQRFSPSQSTPNALTAPGQTFNQVAVKLQLNAAGESLTYNLQLYPWVTDYANSLAQPLIAQSGNVTLNYPFEGWVDISFPPQPATGQYLWSMQIVNILPPATPGPQGTIGILTTPTNGGGPNNDAYNDATVQTTREYGTRLNLVPLTPPECPAEVCTDGIDNDGDARADCSDSDCAANPCCQPDEVCNNTTDDDNDGLADCNDPDCFFFASCLENCSNGIDDNGNGMTDCADIRCGCAANCGPFPAEVCNNGIDDDCDALVDCLDSVCNTAPACQEICNNGIDDNANTLIDCLDPQCVNTVSCPPEICANGVDDDGDGQIDCADSDCDPYADADNDGDVDIDDFGRFQLCITGQGGGVPSGCVCFDRDVDNDVDQDDFNAFVNCVSGPAVLANPNCD